MIVLVAYENCVAIFTSKLTNYYFLLVKTAILDISTVFSLLQLRTENSKQYVITKYTFWASYFTVAGKLTIMIIMVFELKHSKEYATGSKKNSISDI
jgi:hypothetical protein